MEEAEKWLLNQRGEIDNRRLISMIRFPLTTITKRRQGVIRIHSSLLRFGGPVSLAVAVVGEVGDVAGAGGGYSGLYGGVRLLTAFEAVDEVLHVLDGAVAEAGLGEDGVLFAVEALFVDAEARAGQLEGGFSAAELQASVVDGTGHHALVDDVELILAFAFGIAQGRLDGVWAVPLLKDVFVAEHHGFAGGVGLHGPVHDVDPVGEEVGHGSAAKVPEPAPVEELFFAEGLVGCVAEPEFPVEVFDLDGAVGAGPALAAFGEVGLVILPPVGADLDDFAERSPLDETDRVFEVGPAALLHAALENLLARADGFGEDGAFFEGVGDGFLEVDVFACGDGV